MYTLGLYQEKGTIQIAFLQKVKNRIEIVFTRSFPADVKLLDIVTPIVQEHNPVIVTGLAADEVLRRDAVFKLKSKKKILQALPFQIESMIPFPPEETLLLPFFYPQKTETLVILTATQKKHLKNHLQQWALDPHIVSCVPAALARFCAWSFPDQNPLAMILGSVGICVQDQKLLLSQSLETNPERLKPFIEQKCPEAFFVPHDCPHKEFAVPIGLALEALVKDGKTMQFRVEEFSHPKERQREKMFYTTFAAACIFLCLAIVGINSFLIGKKQKTLSTTLDTFLGPSHTSLEQRVEKWQESLFATKKPHTPSPKVSEILAWLSSKKSPIDIQHLHFSLHDRRVELEFTAPSPTVARDFHEELLKPDPLIDPKKEIDWKATQNLYRATFYTRAR